MKSLPIIIFVLSCVILSVYKTDAFIENHLDQYNRSFTVLEISDCNLFETKAWYLSEKYPHGVFVLWNSAISMNEIPPNKQNFIVLSREKNNAIIERLSEVEHFDLTIIEQDIFNDKLLSHFLDMGQYLYVATTTPFHKIQKQLESNKHKNTLLYTNQTDNTHSWATRVDSRALIKRKNCLQLPATKIKDGKTYEVVSNFDSKFFLKTMPKYKRTFKTEWEHGINLVTFKVYEGIYPSSETLKKAIKNTTKIPQIDWAPNNMILQGTKLALIDFTCPPGVTHHCNGRQSRPAFIRTFYKWIDTFDWRDVSLMFWKEVFHDSHLANLVKAGSI